MTTMRGSGEVRILALILFVISNVNCYQHGMVSHKSGLVGLSLNTKLSSTRIRVWQQKHAARGVPANNRRPWSRTDLQMTSTFGSTERPSRSNRPKKSFRDRTQEEGKELIRDIVKLTLEAGPRAGLQRTFQGYLALSTTIRDFLPVKPDGSRGETFSAPVALRKMFERLGTTYIKLGQFIASSPTLFPPEYVLEFQKCLDATEPIKWEVIKKVIEDELGKIPRRVAQLGATDRRSMNMPL
jgi:hypothetical protein